MRIPDLTREECEALNSMGFKSLARRYKVAVQNARRYETLRKLNSRQFYNLCHESATEGKNFDMLVDELP